MCPPARSTQPAWARPAAAISSRKSRTENRNGAIPRLDGSASSRLANDRNEGRLRSPGRIQLAGGRLARVDTFSASVLLTTLRFLHLRPPHEQTEDFLHAPALRSPAQDAGRAL